MYFLFHDYLAHQGSSLASSVVITHKGAKAETSELEVHFRMG